MNIWIQSSRRKPALWAWWIRKMSSQSLREKMVECTGKGVCGLGCTDFNIYILPRDMKRPEFWVWAGMKGSREEKSNFQISNTLMCVQHTTHTFMLMREITGNYLCVHSLEMGLCETLEKHSPTGDCCQLLESGLKRSPGICSCHSSMVTSSSLTTASQRHLNTGGGFLLLLRIPQSSAY